MADWLEIAKGLKAGRKIRVQHCGADNSMLVSHDRHGYRCHCFRCSESEFVPHGLQSIADLNRRKAELSFMEEARVRLPSDYTLDVPEHDMLWYLKAGISPELARSYGIGYSPDMQRVVLPVYGLDGELDAVQMRSTSPFIKPKYLNPAGPKVSAAIFMSGPPTGVTVVVEDILSAIKVGRLTHSTSVLGTTFTDARVAKIAEHNHTVVVWMDNDKAGRKGRLTAVRQLLLQGIEVYRVRTPDDPKSYSLDEIQEHLRRMEVCY